jgi:hypothetical protein
MKNMKFIIGLLLLLMMTPVYSQAVQKIDRTVEIEAELREDIIEYVSRYIPDNSFSVGIKIIPLKRMPQTNTGVDILPFYETSETEIIDEWENPDSSYYVLLNRIQEAQITITVDGNYNIKNESEFRENLFRSVGLVAGRDRLDLKLGDLKVFEKKFSVNDINWNYVVFGFLGILSLALVLYGINRFSPAPKSNQAADNSKDSGSAKGSVSMSPMSNMTENFQVGSSHSIGDNARINGDINFTDSLKLNAFIKERIESVLLKSNFPSLEDLRTLEDFLTVDPLGFSYFVSHFNQAMKDKLLSMGRNQNWIKGFANVGMPSREILLYLEKMVHTTRTNDDKNLEELLIQCWRLNESLKDFLVTIPKNEVKFILYKLPKTQSLSIARNMFPGDWAFLLGENQPDVQVKAARLVELFDSALHYRPFYNPSVVQLYKNKEELITYLRSCGPDEEREIYQSVDSSHSLSAIRAPFYVFFEIEDEKRLEIFKNYDLRMWALACFNISRPLRKKVDDLMNDKEKYLFRSYLTEMDRIKPSLNSITEVREIIATNLYKQQQNEAVSSKTEEDEKMMANNEQAA